MIRRIVRAKELNEEERCAKHQAALANRLAKAESDEASKFDETSENEEDDEAKLPFQDILAEQRRKYTAKQEFVYSIYSDLVGKFVKEREGTYLRKIAKPNKLSDRPTEEHAEEITNEAFERDDRTIKKDEISSEDRKLRVPDENVTITFVNDNSYSGRLSRQKIEGQGLYGWRSGSRFKGEFEDNKIQGKGTLEFQDSSWYEGDFNDGYRHGRGTMVNRDYNLLYVGQWRQGHKHGKGYCRYENGDSYDGDWIMDKPEGVGSRVYPSGARYVGHWKDGLRHGIGTMAWPNGDLYRGEWNRGEIHGYGEYTWNGFFNKTLCWPQEVSYMGGWHEGTRDGRGQLSLNSIGGARYSGEWKKNKKHGCGTIIGNNGDVTEGDPLFENDILLPVALMKDPPEAKDSRVTKSIDSKDTHEFLAKPAEVPEARVTTVLKPEQCLSLWYYVDRLREPKTTSSSSSSVSSISGKCRICEDKSSCRCLRRSREQTSLGKVSRSLSNASSLNGISAAASSAIGPDQANGIFSATKPEFHASESPNFAEEERSAYNCITMHMPRIRNVYDVYSKIFCGDSPKCRLSMSKLSLWQLLRDCGIQKKTGMSLVQIDHCVAANKFTLTEEPNCPFGRIEIWQLIHALLEVSWHIYTRNGDIDAEGYPGRLANGLNKFLLRDIYPNFGKSVGILVGPERDLLPLYPVYQLYLSVGQFHSARQLLNATFMKQGNNESQLLCRPIPEYLAEGKNAVTVGEKLSYLSSDDEPLFRPKPHFTVQKSEDPLAHPLTALRELGTEDFINVMSVICPAIKDPETGLIVNMEYQFTFLEFLEIFVEAGKKLVLKRKTKREADRSKAEAGEAASIVSSVKEHKMSRSIVRLSSAGKTTKSRKKLVTKH